MLVIDSCIMISKIQKYQLAFYNFNTFHKKRLKILNHFNTLMANLVSTILLDNRPRRSNENGHVILSIIQTKLSSYWK